MKNAPSTHRITFSSEYVASDEVKQAMTIDVFPDHRIVVDVDTMCLTTDQLCEQFRLFLKIAGFPVEGGKITYVKESK